MHAHMHTLTNTHIVLCVDTRDKSRVYYVCDFPATTAPADLVAAFGGKVQLTWVTDTVRCVCVCVCVYIYVYMYRCMCMFTWVVVWGCIYYMSGCEYVYMFT